MGSTVTNEECLKYAYCVTVLTQVLTDVLTHLIPKTALRCKYHYYFCISQKETENEGIKSLATETQVASGWLEIGLRLAKTHTFKCNEWCPLAYCVYPDGTLLYECFIF